MRTTLGLLALSVLACAGAKDTGNGDDDLEGEPPQLDLLLVIDTSGSMKEESSALALGLDDIIDSLDGVDWQIGVTTASGDPQAGGSGGVDPGEAGSLVGMVVTSADDNAVETLRAQLLCDTIYWKDSELQSDNQYVAGEDDCPVPTLVSREYLACVCDGETWNTTEGYGNEEGLEALYAAICRDDGDQPDACWDPTGVLTTADAGTNADLWREGVPAAALIVSDEGDGSRRLANGDADPTVYVELYAETSRELEIYVIGPAYYDHDGSCLDSAQTWGVERYQAAAEATGGEYADLTELDENCTELDVATQVAGLLAGAVE